MPPIARTFSPLRFESDLISPRQRNDVKCQQQKWPLFDHFVGGREKRWRDGKTECFAVLRLMISSNFVGS
jgi:hypothetical protein